MSTAEDVLKTQIDHLPFHDLKLYELEVATAVSYILSFVE